VQLLSLQSAFDFRDVSIINYDPGKSFENYATCGSITNRHLEIKTSGRYT
jgi:hypothetical protein